MYLCLEVTHLEGDILYQYVAAYHWAITQIVFGHGVELSPGPPGRIVAEVMEGSLKCGFGGGYHTALNSEVFHRVWKKVIGMRARRGAVSRHAGLGG